MPLSYLSDEWFAAAGDAFADLPERPGATATIQRVITGTPDGDVAYHLTLQEGRIVGVERGTDEGAQATLTLPYKDALRVEHGEDSLNVAFMRGRLKVAGSTGAVLTYLPVTVTPEYEAAQARLGLRSISRRGRRRGELEVAQAPVADALDAGASQHLGQRGVEAHEVVVVDPSGPVIPDGPLLGRVEGGMDVDLGHARLEVVDDALDPPSTPDVHDHQVVREQDTFVGGELAEGEPDRPLGGGTRQPERQAELDREVEVDVEELGAQLERTHVGVEVADVVAPQDRPLHLGPQLAADLVEVGVVPQVLDRAREAAVTVEQGRRLGDRSPPVALELGVERQVHPDVLAAVAPGGVASPGRGHHEAGAGGQAGAQRFVDTRVGRLADAEVVAVDDQEAGVGSVPQTFGELSHPRRRYRRPGRTDTRSRRLARRARAPQASVRSIGLRRDRRQLGSVRGVRADRQGPGEPTGEQGPVDEQAVAATPEVDEQAGVAVPCLAVALEQHGGARRQQLLGPLRRLGPVTLDRRPRLDRLRRVDAQQPDPLHSAADAYVEGVAVHHVDHRGEPAGRAGACDREAGRDPTGAARDAERTGGEHDGSEPAGSAPNAGDGHDAPPRETDGPQGGESACCR